MTPEEIEELKIGEEIDSLILQVVFGYKLLIGEDAAKRIENLHRDVEEKDIMIWINEKEDYYCHHCGNLPRFSEDIREAWTIIDKLGHKFVSLDNNFGHWVATTDFDLNNDQITMVTGSASTAPFAICRAALRMTRT